MKIKTPIICWNCETEYDYQQHEVCPICERHWLDARYKKEAPASGSRVSVKIDYSKKRLKAVPALLLTVFLLIAGCTPHLCPTYSDAGPPADTVLKDTADHFSLAEKTGAVLFGLFVVYAIDNSK